MASGFVRIAEITEQKTRQGCGAGFEGVVNSVEEFAFLIRS